jgi:phosphatidylglycerol:prolipoprotein diacylglycerol transferase
MGFAGLSIQYGVLFTAIVAVIYFSLVLRKPKYMVRDIFATPPIVKQVSMLVYLDAIAPAVLFGQVLGR